jgi:hypothetical protein
MGAWMHGCMGKWVDGWMGGWVDGNTGHMGYIGNWAVYQPDSIVVYCIIYDI